MLYMEKFIDDYSRENVGRPTRLGVFAPENGNVTDYWIENGLPLVGIDIDTHKARSAVEIRVGDYSHQIADAVRISFHMTPNGADDGIDVLDGDNKVTLLRFEGLAAKTPGSEEL